VSSTKDTTRISDTLVKILVRPLTALNAVKEYLEAGEIGGNRSGSGYRPVDYEVSLRRRCQTLTLLDDRRDSGDLPKPVRGLSALGGYYTFSLF